MALLIFYDHHTESGVYYSLRGDNSALDLCKSASGGRKGWTHIAGCSSSTMFLYNCNNGFAQFYGFSTRLVPDETLSNSQSYTLPTSLFSSATLSSGWSHILQGGIAEDGVLPLLFFYNRESGDASFFKPDWRSGIHQLTSTTLSEGWTHIVSFDSKTTSMLSLPHICDLLFYNRQNGLVQIYSTDDQMSMREVACITLSSGWTHIISTGNFTIPNAHLLLFYNQNNGEFIFYALEEQYTMRKIFDHRWEKGWSHILFKTFSPDQKEQPIPTLLFYDRSNGETRFYRLHEPGCMNQIFSTTLFPQWTHALWIDTPTTT